MLTQCPACETRFRVTPEQLKARSGRVRCGACQHVFNALDSLVEEPLIVAAPSLPAVEKPPAAAPEEAPDEIAVPPAPTFELVPEEHVSLPPETEEQPIPEPIEATEATEPEPEVPATAAPIAAESEIPEWSATATAAPAAPRRWPWAIGILVAIAMLGLQTLLAFRVEIAVLWPQAKPSLIALCQIASCEVGLPAKIALVSIEASDLNPDSEHKGRLALTATLKNRAPFAQQFPHLELTLTDTADKALARKILAPADYLPAKTSSADGMPPNADIMVAVGIDSGDMAASGYRLYLFYP